MTSTLTTDTADLTGTFPRRPRSGIVMGLRAGQIALVAVAGIATLIALFSSTVPAGIRGVILGTAAVLILLAVAVVDDRPAYRWVIARASHALRAVRGNTVVSRPIHVGAAPVPSVDRAVGLLPGRAASIQLYEHDGVGYLYHPHQGTLTGVVEVTSPEFLLRDPADRNARVAGWGRVLAAATRTGTIAQVHLLERSIPDDGSSMTTYTDTHLSSDPDDATLAGTYRALTGHLRGGADRHQSFLAITIARAGAGPQIKAARGRITGLVAVWQQEFTLLAKMLPTAGLDVVQALSARGIAEVIRTGFDPATALRIPPDGGVDPAVAGPVGGREEWSYLRTDGSFHAVLWVAEWPNGQAAADFLWPVIFPSGIQRTLSLFYRPFTRAQSEAAIRAKHSEIIQSSFLKDKLGRVETLADSKELTDVMARETELLRGHGEVALLGMVTVSAGTLDELEAAITTVHAAATQASMDLRRVTGQQLQAFTAAAVPLGILVVA
jgi:hypothetical protein